MLSPVYRIAACHAGRLADNPTPVGSDLIIYAFSLLFIEQRTLISTFYDA